jgi:hypothetical protein
MMLEVYAKKTVVFTFLRSSGSSIESSGLTSSSLSRHSSWNGNYHVVQNRNGLGHIGSLETSRVVGLYHFFEVVGFVEVVA